MLISHFFKPANAANNLSPKSAATTNTADYHSILADENKTPSSVSSKSINKNVVINLTDALQRGEADAKKPLKDAADVCDLVKETKKRSAPASQNAAAPASQAKKAKKKPVEFFCTPDLLEWHDNDTLWKELDNRNTQSLKEICLRNGVPRSGPKYQLTQLLREHAAKASRSRRDEGLAAAAADGDVSQEVELSFSKFKSFEAADNHLTKVLEKMNKNAKLTLEQRCATLIGNATPLLFFLPFLFTYTLHDHVSLDSHLPLSRYFKMC